MAAREGPFDAQIERILDSDTLRNSEALRRLLRYLADKSTSGEAGHLKEYAVGIDALGKPPAYDPRHDSVVRIQVGRLRQKLAEYYRSEGRNDPVLIDLPKGGYRLLWEARPEQTEQPGASPGRTRGRGVLWAVSAALVLAMAWALAVSVQLWRERRAGTSIEAAWTPELRLLWQPFLETNRPLVVAVSSPLFVGLQGEGYYRDLSLNEWASVLKSPKIEALRKSLNNPPILPRYNYTGFSILASTFRLAEILAVTEARVSVIRSSQLSWQQLADNNVLLIGAPRVFSGQLDELPIELAVELRDGGVTVRDPRPGEAAFLPDDSPSIASQELSATPDDGEVYAVITSAPGPLGIGAIGSFSSNRSHGAAAAVQSFTDPALARALVGRLRRPSGELPRYYQVVLKARYKDGVPTDVTYVLHRELAAAPQPSAGKE